MRKLMTLLTALFVAVMMLPSVAKAEEEDTRQVITEVNVTMEGFTYGCGEPVVDPTITVPEDAGYRIDSTYWVWKGEGASFTRQVDAFNGGSFVPGTWSFYFKVRIDGENISKYRLPNTEGEFTAYVNGEKWDLGLFYVGDDYCFTWVKSHDFVISDEGVELGFCNPTGYDGEVYVPSSWKGTPIEAIEVTDYAYGGEKPYVFSKVSGPSWLIVDPNGTISGTPDIVGENENLVLRVTDAAGAMKDIDISVNSSNVDPNARTVLSSFTGTTDLGTKPVYGENFYYVGLHAPEGAHFDIRSGYWEKKNADNSWSQMSETETFAGGVYRYTAQIRIEYENGKLYRLPKRDEGVTVKVVIDGEEWLIRGDCIVQNTFSYVDIYSPEFTVYPITIYQVDENHQPCNEEFYKQKYYYFYWHVEGEANQEVAVSAKRDGVDFGLTEFLYNHSYGVDESGECGYIELELVDEPFTLFLTSVADPTKTGEFEIQFAPVPEITQVALVDEGPNSGETSFMVYFYLNQEIDTDKFPGSRIYVRKKVNDGSWYQVEDIPYEGGKVVQYYDNDIEPGSAYSYQAFWHDVEKNIHGETTECSLAKKAVARAPLVPKNITVTQVASTVHIDWDASAGAKSYRVLRASAETAPSGFWPTDAFIEVAAGLTTNSYVDADVQPGYTYGYWIKAVNKDAESQESSTTARTRKITVVDASLDAEFKHSCSFQNKIEVNFKAVANLDDYDEFWLSLDRQVFSGEGAEFTWSSVQLKDYSIDDLGRYVFTYDDIAAAEMGDLLHAKLCAKKGNVIYESGVDEYSVQIYCENKLGGVNASTNKAFRKLVVDTLNYGAAAQIYFKRNTGNLVNDILTTEWKAEGSLKNPTLASVNKATTNGGMTAEVKNKSVSFNSGVELNLYTTYGGSVPGPNVKVVLSYVNTLGNSITESVMSNKFTESPKDGVMRYRAVFTRIATADFGQPLTIQIYDGTTLISETYTYSIETYAFNRLKDSTDDNFKALLNAMMNYSQSAKNYFTSTE